MADQSYAAAPGGASAVQVAPPLAMTSQSRSTTYGPIASRPQENPADGLSQDIRERRPSGARAYAKPAVYLVADTRRPVPFDEAFAPANSAAQPLLSDTVWIMRATHPALALAHELVHVLTDSGEHASQTGNLMREQTAPENTKLVPDQCRQKE